MQGICPEEVANLTPLIIKKKLNENKFNFTTKQKFKLRDSPRLPPPIPATETDMISETRIISDTFDSSRHKTEKDPKYKSNNLVVNSIYRLHDNRKDTGIRIIERKDIK
jgi:hypothetical protein